MPSTGWATWRDVPTGEQSWIQGQVDIWEQSTGFQVPIDTPMMLSMVNGGVETQLDIGKYVSTNLSAQFQSVLSTMPWAQYGLDKDTYQQMAGAFGTEFKKVTGQDITKDALQQAFQGPRALGGGLLTASQYAQQLMNDVNIQNTYGWVKYGLDYSQWTQQKLQSQTAFGRTLSDTDAATLLQYTKSAPGSNMSVTARQSGGQQQQPVTVGVGGSIAR